jgi:predicted ATPase
MSLFSITKGKVACDLIFSITDQIKHGIACLSTENSELRIDVAELFEMAGMKASASSDHVSSCSYLTRALSLLPTDHWKCQYDTSIRLSLRCAKSCYSCGETEKAQCILEDTMVHCLSLTDKLPLYGLLAKSECRRRLGF